MFERAERSTATGVEVKNLGPDVFGGHELVLKLLNNEKTLDFLFFLRCSFSFSEQLVSDQPC